MSKTAAELIDKLEQLAEWLIKANQHIDGRMMMKLVEEERKWNDE